ncbi:hypothetical protein [Chitinophaga cymbidii]|nr:hypothetical protein [Chitinophaga cymbidii]
MELINLFTTGDFYPRLKVGQTKGEMENILGFELGEPDIETEDVDYYLLKMITGVCLVVLFDKEKICFEIRLDLDKNKHIDFMIKCNDHIQRFDSNISFESLIDIIRQMKIEWEFDKRRSYLQTICISLKNGLKVYYAFGERSADDYGFFSVKRVLEGHFLND